MQEDLEKLKEKVITVKRYLDIDNIEKEDEFRESAEVFIEKIDEILEGIANNQDTMRDEANKYYENGRWK